MATLEGVRDRQEQIMQMLRVHASSARSSEDIDDILPSPVSNEEELQSLEEKLKIRENRKKIGKSSKVTEQSISCFRIILYTPPDITA